MNTAVKLEVKKHVAAIHVNGDLSLLERKISNVLLVNAYDNLLTAREHKIPTSILCQLLGFDSNNIRALKEALKKLVSTSISWDIMGDDGKNEWGVSTLLASGAIKAGICTYEYSATLARKLYNPETYASINLSVQRKFSSSYALAVYENCLRYKGIGSTGWIDLEIFKKLVGLDMSAYYDSFKHLNLKIIKPAVNEVNKQSDITIQPEFKKEKRRVISIKFAVSQNPQLTLINETMEDDKITLSIAYQRLIGYAISERLAAQWITQYGEDYINQKLDYTESQETIGQIKGSPSGFLVSAVTNDYQAPPPKKTRAQPKPKTEAQQQKQQAKKEQQKVDAYLAGLPPDQLEALRADFLQAYQDDKVVMQQYRRNGFKSAAVQALFRGYVKNRE